jgi:hypothetical protein
MVVILVYAQEQSPATLVVHGHNQMSWFQLVDAPDQPAQRRLEKTIQEVLNSKGNPE